MKWRLCAHCVSHRNVWSFKERKCFLCVRSALRRAGAVICLVQLLKRGRQHLVLLQRLKASLSCSYTSSNANNAEQETAAEQWLSDDILFFWGSFWSLVMGVASWPTRTWVTQSSIWSYDNHCSRVFQWCCSSWLTCHPGVAQICFVLQQRFWRPVLAKDVREFVAVLSPPKLHLLSGWPVVSCAPFQCPLNPGHICPSSLE